MKTYLMAVFIALGMFAGKSSFAQDTNAITAGVNFVNVSPAKVLDVYQAATRQELVVASDVRLANHPITLRFAGSPAALPELLQQALWKQSGILITRLDERRASVTYNDHWAFPK